MDVFRMKCFICVAESQSMSEAARKMLITRPAMTAQMNALESEMGATLLLRDKKGTRLTPAGKQVFETFKKVVAQLDDLGAEVRRIDLRRQSRLRIGFHGPAEWMNLGRLLAKFREDYPQVEMEISQLPWNVLASCVEDGTLDAAFIELSDAEDLSALSVRPLYKEALCAAMRKDNPLAQKASITPDQLFQSELFLPNSAVGPRYFRDLVMHFRSVGVNIHETGIGNISEATLMLASAGYGIAIMPRSFKQNLTDVTFVDIESGIKSVNMGLVWRTDSKNAALEPFRSLCESWEWNKEKEKTNGETSSSSEGI